MTPSGLARAITAVILTVPDLAAAARFYGEALGFSAVSRTDRLAPKAAAALGAPQARIASVGMRLGAQRLDLLAFDPPGRPYPAGSTSSDLWFQHCAIVVSDMAAAYAHLKEFGTTPITRGGPQILPPNTGSVTAYKFRDPFGHPLELLHVPPGVGDAGWHRPGGGELFLGIDHTAIAVGDAARSIRFYEGVLGLRATSRSHNTGLAQSRLDAIDDAAVDVVAMAPDRPPPHLELLAYEAGTRRSRAADWGPSDIAATRTVIDVADFATFRGRLDAADHPGPVVSQGRAAVALADPDGHLLIVGQAP